MVNKIIAVPGHSLIKTPIALALSYSWNGGSFLGLTLISQLITGIILVIFYTCDTERAFNRVEYIIREVNSGWWFRVLHFNGARLLFAGLYFHMLRGIRIGA